MGFTALEQISKKSRRVAAGTPDNVAASMKDRILGHFAATEPIARLALDVRLSRGTLPLR